MNIGIICPSNIAIRRFLPALKNNSDFQFAGIGIAGVNEIEDTGNLNQADFDRITADQKNKAYEVVKEYGGTVFNSYYEAATSPNVDALYLPLPPAMHYKWAKLALLHGKHVMVEKPSTVSYEESRELVEIAGNNHLSLHENYMFVFHKQLEEISQLLQSGVIGDIRLYRISFGFPRRSADDFRYNKQLGGGALLDAGGYTIRYACDLLGNSARLVYAELNYSPEFDVDLYGSGALVNDHGMTAQISFGMDNSYKCELEVWGSKGILTTNRVLTAPAGFIPTVHIQNSEGNRMIELSSDDAFAKSIKYFASCIKNEEKRSESNSSILKQAEMIDSFRQLSAAH